MKSEEVETLKIDSLSRYLALKEKKWASLREMSVETFFILCVLFIEETESLVCRVVCCQDLADCIPVV